jgi:hypothetical protein
MLGQLQYRNGLECHLPVMQAMLSKLMLLALAVLVTKSRISLLLESSPAKSAVPYTTKIPTLC